MSLLSCNCLNIQIPVERTPMPNSQPPKELIPERDFNTISLLVSEKKNHIFSSNLIHLPITPDHTRIKVESLAGVQKLGTWIIVRCVNCHIDCYMFDRSPLTPHTSTLYVNSQLTYNPDTIRTLSGSSDLSPAFGIVIRTHPDSDENRDSDVDVSQLLRQKVREYITQVKQDTDDRIRAFTVNETKRVSALERRAWSDFKNVLSNIEKEPTQLNLATPLFMSPPHLSPAVSISSTNSQQDFPPSLTDFDDLPFELEGFVSTGGHSDPYLSSEDELEDSDSRSEASSIENFAQVSRSMPISITSTSLHSRMNDRKVEPIRLDEIHNSMKILAQSVTDPHYRDLPLSGHYQRDANHI